MTASGIYQIIVRRGRQCGVDVFPHRFRHHFSHTWLDRGRAESSQAPLKTWKGGRQIGHVGIGSPATMISADRPQMYRQIGHRVVWVLADSA
jgi:hypothetical protein